MRARVLLIILAILSLALLPPAEASAAPARGVWNVSLATWYGPGLYGRGTACGQRLTPQTLGVAHRRLPCGHLVELEWHGRRTVVPVIDRGPFTRAEWDLTEATCRLLTAPGRNRCHTGVIAWRL